MAKHRFLILFGCFLTLSTGCGTLRIVDHDIPDFSNGGAYPATRADVRSIFVGIPRSGDIRLYLCWPLMFVDIPVALLVDTFFLPRDITESDSERFVRMLKEGEKKLDSHDLVFEMKLPKSATFGQGGKIEFETEHGSSSIPVTSTNEGEGGNGQKITDHLTISAGEQRRAIIFQPAGSVHADSQVFVLDIPKRPVSCDWTQWRPPDHVVKHGFTWSFWNEHQNSGISTNLPANCVLLRYRIESEKP